MEHHELSDEWYLHVKHPVILYIYICILYTVYIYINLYGYCLFIGGSYVRSFCFGIVLLSWVIL